MMRPAATATMAAACLTLWAGGCVEEVPLDGARCDAQHPCPAGFACQNGSCRRLGGDGARRCDGDIGCALGVCHPEAGFCVQCVDDADCTRGVCLEGTFQCGCDSADDCDTWRCALLADAKAGYCASCYADEQCGGDRWCDRQSGVCQASEKDRRDATASRKEARGP